MNTLGARFALRVRWGGASRRSLRRWAAGSTLAATLLVGWPGWATWVDLRHHQLVGAWLGPLAIAVVAVHAGVWTAVARRAGRTGP